MGFQYSVSKKDLPTFRFGNGLSDRAISRVDLQSTSLGSLSFFVLGGAGRNTLALIGARTLRDKKALLSYGEGLFLYLADSQSRKPSTVKMHSMFSRHVAIDLTENPTELEIQMPASLFTDMDFSQECKICEGQLNVRRINQKQSRSQSM